jgi:hypothetical protein
MGRQPSLWKFGSLITKKAPEIRGFFRLVGGDGGNRITNLCY